MIKTWKLVVVFAAAIVYGVTLIIWANECASIGGAYLLPDNGFPVCVQGAK